MNVRPTATTSSAMTKYASEIAAPRPTWPRGRTSAAVLAGYILIAFAYWGVRLLPHPGRFLVGNGTDTQIFVWSFAWWPHALGHGLNPFEASSIWAPKGVNLAWTATAPGMALLFTPLTLLTGPIV